MDSNRAAQPDSLDELDALVAGYDSDDDAAQDLALAQAESLAHRIWGSYREAILCLARRAEGGGDDPVAAAMAALRLREEADEPGHLIDIARRRRRRMPPSAGDAVVALYGDEVLARAPTPFERIFITAARSLADPGEDPLDPFARLAGWVVPWHVPPEPLRVLVAAAWPLPFSVAAARDEARLWEERRRQRASLDAGPTAALPTACAARHRAVVDLWRADLCAASPADLAARLEYWVEFGGDDGKGYKVLQDDLAAMSLPAVPPDGSRERIRRLKTAHPDWSLAQIGAVLGISRQAVHKHLKRDGG